MNYRVFVNNETSELLQRLSWNQDYKWLPFAPRQLYHPSQKNYYLCWGRGKFFTWSSSEGANVILTLDEAIKFFVPKEIYVNGYYTKEGLLKLAETL